MSERNPELPEHLGLRWYPVPLRPWQVVDEGGRTIKTFDSPSVAQRWLEKRGYQIDEEALGSGGGS